MARRSSRICILLVAAALVFCPGTGLAASPTSQVKGTIDRVISILKQPEHSSKAGKEKRREALRGEIRPVFDFDEMAKRSLGIHWRKRTPEEKEQFVRLFEELLENSYLGKIESYKGEEIRYVKETVDSPYAEVHTLVVTGKGQEIPIDYRMLLSGDRWRIYDVVIEGISLVNNYRSQFGSILQKSPYEDLVKKLRATIKEQPS